MHATRPLPGRMGICADLSVPGPLVVRLRLAGVRVRASRQDRVDEASASAVYAWVRRLHRILLSLDRRYWDDAAYPIDQAPGVLLLDFPPQDLDAAHQAFDLAYEVFGTWLDVDEWNGIKVLSGPAFCRVKMAQPEGGVKEYVITREAGLLFVEPAAGGPAPTHVGVPASATPAAPAR